ncbi:hypothetical protein FB45DRAFT_877328 [Roridomyces roridus]|uniref:Uncharacterized protein n=1 Tax=Roridomyces roridus TaxID=1738132 RepID=A0AAD7B2G5_9AGAR|nr:hypothetical protein FB45DRAFT_1041752 [Roridomyces roridus]KAJ7608157.1 hypothetical protein FB45DRAFT_877328 [Roridomyces roridus]
MSSTSELTRILSGTSDGIGSISSTRRDSVDSLPRETRLRSACDSSKRTSYLFAFPYDYESRSEDSDHCAPPKYTRRPVVLTEAQEMNPPTLPSVSPITALLRAAKRVLPTSRRARNRDGIAAPLPTPVNPKSLSVADISVMVESSSGTLPRGPAPTVSRKRMSMRGPVDPAVAAGW